MKRRRTAFVVAAMWLTVSAGCATSPPAAERGDGADNFISCQEPRPEICTMDYLPVCGALQSGDKKTYANACVACSDTAVNGYTKSVCATGTFEAMGSAPDIP